MMQTERQTRLMLTATILGLMALGTGCTQVMTEVGKKAFEDRTTENQVKDTKLATGILTDLANKDKGLVLDLNVDVWEQRVLVTGTLSDRKVHDEVMALIRRDARIKTVYDEIQMVSAEEQAQRRKDAEQQQQQKNSTSEGVERSVNDFWIETKINAKLLSETDVRSVNFRWRSVRKHVFVIGLARSKAEQQRVVDICSMTDGVLDVKHYIEVR